MEKLESPKKQELPRDEAAAAFWHMRSMLQKKQGTICVPCPGHIGTKLRRGRFSLDIRKNFLVVGIVENWNKFF